MYDTGVKGHMSILFCLNFLRKLFKLNGLQTCYFSTKEGTILKIKLYLIKKKQKQDYTNNFVLTIIFSTVIFTLVTFFPMKIITSTLFKHA